MSRRDDISKAHDRGYRLLFSYPRMVEDLLRGFVDEPFVGDLDFATLERTADSYVSDDLAAREQDVVWRLRWHGKPLYIYLLIEFQSTVDRAMAVRMMVYLGLLYQDLLKRRELSASGKLPPVLPIVIYNGSSPWNAALELGGLVETTPARLATYQPALRYLLIDERRLPDRDLDGAANLVAALFRLEHSERLSDIALVVGRLARWLRAPEDQALRRAFASWLKRVLLPRRAPGGTMDAPEEVDEMLEERVAQWTQELLQEGREEGREQGERIGEAKVLERLLKLKFGPVDEATRSRIDGASSETLLRWAEQVLDAKRLADVFR